MSTISQRIPNLFLGISQQPDSKKFPGQVKDAVNTLPDFALGMLKRPGGEYIESLTNATTTGRWFSILRDQNEKYVAQYANNVFRIWSLTDGSPRAVNMGTNTGVPGTCNFQDTLSISNAGTGLTDGTFTDLATATTGSGTGLTVDLEIAGGVVTTVTINQYGSGYTHSDTITMVDTATYPDVEFSYVYQLKSRLADYNAAVAVTKTRLDELHTAQSTYAETLAGQDSTQEELFDVRFNYSPASVPSSVYETYLYSGILKEADGTYIVKNADTVVSVNTTLPAGYSLGNERTDEQPKLAAKGYRVFTALLAIAAVNPDTLTITAAGSGLTDGTYEDLETATTGSGQNLTADIVISGGVVTSASINAKGWDYVDGDTVTLTDGAYSAVSFEYQSATQEAEAAMNTAQTNYDAAVSDELTKLGLYNDEVADCAITTIPANAYLKDADPKDIEVLTLNDYTFVLNKGKTVQMDAATTSAAIPHQAFVVLSIVGTGHYQITLDGTIRGTYNAGTGGDVDAILNDLVSDIDGQTFGGTTFSATRVGPGIYISATAAFSIEVVGGPGQDAMYVFQDTVSTVSSLPSQAKDGYVVKVVNSAEIDVDDMWVKFITSSGGAYGVGTWEETVGPGITYKFDPLTMPHQLVRQADGSFNFEPVTWDERVIGDLSTNPDPSFVGATIKHMFLYRNRLGFLSNETVTMSRAGDLFNFFNTTALTATDDDPIDISASTAKPVTLYYVRPTAVGLILFGDTEQFLLSTDSDILSPKTAKINTMSSYECEPDVEAVSTGISTNFIAKSPLYTKLFNLGEIRNDSPPLAEELTLNIPELIPSTIDSFISSAAASIISLGTIGSSTLYQYRFLQLTENRVQSWYKWTLTGTLLDQFFDQSTFYAVVANGSNVEVQAFNLRQSSDEGFLTLPTGEKTDVFLDYWSINPYRTYDSSSDTTRVFLPYDVVSGKTFVVVAIGGYIGGSNETSSQSVGAILEPTVAGSAGAYYADIDGDYRGRDLIIGFQYEMSLELPKFFITQKEGNYVSSDQTADLILHRINVATSLSGPVTYEVDLTGIPTWENVVSTTLPNTYVLNNVNLSADSLHVVPIYQRNKSTSIRIIGDTPFPVTLLDLTWEGKYSNRFYRGS